MYRKGFGRSLHHSGCIDINIAMAGLQAVLTFGTVSFGTFLIFPLSMFSTAKVSYDYSLSGRSSFSMRKPFWH